MLTAPVQTRITLDDLAAELLPPPLITAITHVTLEHWRRYTMTEEPAHRSARTLPAPAQRVLPVVVFGDTVFQPVRFPDPLVVPIEDGKSYRAMQDAMRTDSDVLLVFVAEGALAGFRSSVPQALPTVGVIARVKAVGGDAGPTHRIEIEGVSRAEIRSAYRACAVLSGGLCPAP